MDTIRNDTFGKVGIQNLLVGLEEKLLQSSCHTKKNRTRILKKTSRREEKSGKKLDILCSLINIKWKLLYKKEDVKHQAHSDFRKLYLKWWVGLFSQLVLKAFGSSTLHSIRKTYVYVSTLCITSDLNLSLCSYMSKGLS